MERTTPRAFLGGYYAEFDDVFHTEEECPAGRMIPDELRVDGPPFWRLWCPSCQARAGTRLVGPVRSFED